MLSLVRVTYLGTRRSGFGKTVQTYLREMFRGVDARPRRYVLQDDELARMGTPVTIVWGRDDEGDLPISEVRRRFALIRNARFELVPGGHEPWLDDLDSTARHVVSLPGRTR